MATAYEKAKKNVKDTKKAKGIVQKQKKVTANDLKFSWEYDTLTKKQLRVILKTGKTYLVNLIKKAWVIFTINLVPFFMISRYKI